MRLHKLDSKEIIIYMELNYNCHIDRHDERMICETIHVEKNVQVN